MSRGKRVDSGAAGGARGDRGAPGLLRERIRQLERPTLPEVAGDAMRLSPSTERQFGRAREIGGRGGATKKGRSRDAPGRAANVRERLPARAQRSRDVTQAHRSLTFAALPDVLLR